MAQKSEQKTVIQKDSKGNIHWIEYSKTDWKRTVSENGIFNSMIYK